MTLIENMSVRSELEVDNYTIMVSSIENNQHCEVEVAAFFFM